MCVRIYFQNGDAEEIESPRQFTQHFGVDAEPYQDVEIDIDFCLCNVDVEGALTKLGVAFEKDDWQDIMILEK